MCEGKRVCFSSAGLKYWNRSQSVKVVFIKQIRLSASGGPAVARRGLCLDREIMHL